MSESSGSTPGPAWRKWILRIGAAAALVAGGVALAAWARQDPLKAEYPDSPFPRVPADYPHILPFRLEEPSPKDAAAYHASVNERFDALKYLVLKGALSRVSEEQREAFVSATMLGLCARPRELALKALQKDPNSIPARLALAHLEAFHEGNLPRALLHVRHVRRQLYRRGREKPDDETAREWFLLALEKESVILDMLSRSEEELRVEDVIEQIYFPRPWCRVKALIKLRRFEEAKEICRQAEALGGAEHELRSQRIDMARLEGRRKECCDLARQAMAADPDDCLAYKNFAIAARDDFRLQESYDAIMKATGLHPNYRGSPFQLLCDSCLDQCRPAEAWDALKKYQDHRRLREAYTLQFDQNELDATAARMFLALGRPETAVRFARRRVERPQRLAYSAAEGRDETFSAELALLEALRDRLEQLREQSAEGGAAGQADAAESIALQFECWALEKRLLRALGDEQFLLRRLRPPRPDNVLRLLPGGVAAEALRRARQKEEHPSAEPYFDALEAELAWHRGRYTQALALARKALDKLPADFEKYLRARLAVVAGESARKLGKTDEMWPLFDQALRDCPAVFRMYRVAIPVGLSDDGTPLARALGRRILASPRFRNDPAGFPVSLRTAGGQLTFELSRLGQARHCADSVGAEGAAAEVVATACRRLHQRLMSPSLDLKPIDVNFLEGSLFAAPPGEQIDRTIGLIKAR